MTKKNTKGLQHYQSKLGRIPLKTDGYDFTDWTEIKSYYKRTETGYDYWGVRDDFNRSNGDNHLWRLAHRANNTRTVSLQWLKQRLRDQYRKQLPWIKTVTD